MTLQRHGLAGRGQGLREVGDLGSSSFLLAACKLAGNLEIPGNLGHGVGFVFIRYHMAEPGGAALRSVHRSATCCVYFAKDLRLSQTSQQRAWCSTLRNEPPFSIIISAGWNRVSFPRNWFAHDTSANCPVALKFVKTKEHFEQEIRSRKLLKDGQELGCVVELKGYSWQSLHRLAM